MKPDNLAVQQINWPVWRTSFFALGCVILALCALYWPVLTDMARIWFEDTTYNHGFLVAPISVWLIYSRREELVEINPRPSLLTATLLVIPALIMAVGNAGSLAIFEHFAFVGMIVVLIVGLLGWQFAWKFWFPIGFLLFMVPLGVELVPALQYITAQASVWLLRMSGVPVFLDGILIQLPNGLFEVAEACAGIRFLIANIVIAALFAYFCFRKWWKIAIFMTLSVLIPIGANCLRAYGIMMIAHKSNNELAVGVDHLVYGWIFFTFVMVLVLWVGTLFADQPWSAPIIFKEKLSFTTPTPPARKKILAVSSVLILLVVSMPVINAINKTSEQLNLPPNYPQILLPENTKWTRKPVDINIEHYWSPVFKTADTTYRIDYQHKEKTVEVFIAWVSKQEANREIIHFSNRFDDDIFWKRGQLGTITLPAAKTIDLPQTARLDRITTPYSSSDSRFRSKMVVSWYWVNNTLTSDARVAKLRQIQATLTGQNPSAGVITLATNYEELQSEAVEILEDFMGAMNKAPMIFEKMEPRP